MNRFAVTAIFALIALILVILFIYLLSSLFDYKMHNNEASVVSVVRPKLVNKEIGNSWQFLLSKKRIADFQPMTNELYIHFELVNAEQASKRKFYKLKIDHKDSYSLFCIRHTIEELKLKFFFVSTKKDVNIIIDTNDASMMHSLVDTLKTYKIGSTFEEIWI